MTQGKKITPSYTFESTVYVKFIDRTDFKLAKYNDISLEGFSCFCNKELEIGEDSRVEINLKMISGGVIDDLEPHIATAKLMSKEMLEGKSVYRFKFIDFEENCFTGLVIATEYLDKKDNQLNIDSTGIDNIDQLPISDIILDISKKITDGKISLPVLPKVVTDVEGIIKKPDCSVTELADTIEKDAVISAKLIATANSPFYRGTSHIVTVRETIPRLGFAETRNLVLTIANKSLYSTKNHQMKQLFEKLWIHSLFSAYCAKSIANETGIPNSDALFTYGLIHNIGQTLLLRILGELLEKKKIDISDIVKHVIDHSHNISCLIIKSWNFTEKEVVLISDLNKNNFNQSTDKSTLILNLTSKLAILLDFGIDEKNIELENLDSLKLLGLEKDNVIKIGEKVKNMLLDSGNSF